MARGGASWYSYLKRPGDRENGDVRKRASLFINARSAEELVFAAVRRKGSIWSPIAGATAMCGGR